ICKLIWTKRSEGIIVEIRRELIEVSLRFAVHVGKQHLLSFAQRNLGRQFQLPVRGSSSPTKHQRVCSIDNGWCEDYSAGRIAMLVIGTNPQISCKDAFEFGCPCLAVRSEVSRARWGVQQVETPQFRESDIR